jgi:DNA-binding XRE family transcriptional regulator
MNSMKKVKTTSLDVAIDRFVGPLGTSEREAFEQELSAEILGRSVRHARLSKGLTQEQLGQMVGVQKAQISRIENRVRDVRLDTVLRVLGVLRFRVVPISEAGHELG